MLPYTFKDCMMTIMNLVYSRVKLLCSKLHILNNMSQKNVFTCFCTIVDYNRIHFGPTYFETSVPSPI